MNPTIGVQQIRETIKKLLKKHGGTYADLGDTLNISVAAVKRLMTKGEMSIDRLELIAAEFGLSLLEFLAVAQNFEIEPFQFSKQQEAVLVKKPNALYLMLLLGAGFPLKDLKTRVPLSEQKIRESLFALAKINLIEILDNDRIKLKCRGPFLWQKGGALEQRYYRDFREIFADLVRHGQSDKNDLHIVFEFYLSEKLRYQMQTELRAVYNKYRNLARIEHEIVESKFLQPVAGCIVMKPLDAWGRLLLADTNTI